MQWSESLQLSVQELSQYLFDPSQRIFALYLLGAVLLSIPVFFYSHKRRTEMEQEDDADERHHDHFFEELALEGSDSSTNEIRAVIGGVDLNAGG